MICFLEITQASFYSVFTKIGICQLELSFIMENSNCVVKKEVGLAKCFAYIEVARFLLDL